MLTYIKINGFKSFHNFEMIFTPLTVVAGLNGSGKSNLFDALRLLARLAETDMKTAFNEQRGHSDELFTQYSEGEYADEMEFIVEMLVDRQIKDNWGGVAELNNTRLRYRLCIGRGQDKNNFQSLNILHEHLEQIKQEEDTWAKEIIPSDNKDIWTSQRAGSSKEVFILTETEGNVTTIKVRQDGSQSGKATPANAVSQTVLSGINSVDFPHAFAAKEEMRSWRFLQLNPEDLREPTRQDLSVHQHMSSSGKNLAAALFRIKQHDPYTLTEISRKLNSFLPNFTAVEVYDDKANRQYIIKLRGEDQKEFTTRVLSEGTLRLLALCVLEYDEQHTGLLCFEEPENGIHPFRIAAMAALLKDLSVDFVADPVLLRQVIVNTHSPVLVAALSKMQSDKLVSVYLSDQHILFPIHKDKKYKIRATRAIPVINEGNNSSQMTLFSSEHERKITLLHLEQYLHSSDTESSNPI
jgi:predicted ATPase